MGKVEGYGDPGELDCMAFQRFARHKFEHEACYVSLLSLGYFIVHTSVILVTRYWHLKPRLVQTLGKIKIAQNLHSTCKSINGETLI